MSTYSLEIVTAAGSADSAFLDRLADIAYALPQLVNLHMGLNGDGSLSAFFDVDAEGALAAAELGVRLFAGALEGAGIAAGAATSAIARFQVAAASIPDLATA